MRRRAAAGATSRRGSVRRWGAACATALFVGPAKPGGSLRSARRRSVSEVAGLRRRRLRPARLNRAANYPHRTIRRSFLQRSARPTLKAANSRRIHCRIFIPTGRSVHPILQPALGAPGPGGPEVTPPAACGPTRNGAARSPAAPPCARPPWCRAPPRSGAGRRTTARPYRNITSW